MAPEPPEEVRVEVQSLLRGRHNDEFGTEVDLRNLIRRNPAWRAEIAAAVAEVIGDPRFDWQTAQSALKAEGLTLPVPGPNDNVDRPAFG